MNELSKSERSLLTSYEKGPRIWDAASLQETVGRLHDLGMISPVMQSDDVFEITDQGRLELSYCPGCKHPWSYHGEHGCSMPVTPGTNLPITRGSDARERCGCTALTAK